MGLNYLDQVSVIITTYKREPKMLKRAVQSVLNQTYTNLEVIVVDDSPSDYELRPMVESAVSNMDSRVKYIKHQQNLGACAARNTGINNSVSDFVAFLDDDDEWLPEKLEKQMKKFDDASVGLVYCQQYVCDENGVVGQSQHKAYTGNVYDKLILSNFIGSTSLVVMRKSIALKAGLFDPEIKSAQDLDMWIRVSKISKVECVCEPLLKYYVHSGERISGNPKNKIQGQERIIQKYYDDIVKNKEAFWRRYMNLSNMYCWDKQYSKAVKYYFTALSKQPLNISGNIKYALKNIQYTILSLKKRG